jgi:hypothetical protein
MRTFERFVTDQIAERRRQRQFVQDEGLPLVVLDLPTRDQQLIADFRTFILHRLGLLGFAVLDARLEGHPVSMFVGVPACGSPTKGLVSFVVRTMNRLAGEFSRRVGDRDFRRRLKAVFKREAAARRL